MISLVSISLSNLVGDLPFNGLTSDRRTFDPGEHPTPCGTELPQFAQLLLFFRIFVIPQLPFVLDDECPPISEACDKVRVEELTSLRQFK